MKTYIHIFATNGPSASASCYEVLEQVRDSCCWYKLQVRDTRHKVLLLVFGKKSSVPVFLFSQFYCFTYHYIIRYQNKKQDNRNKD